MIQNYLNLYIIKKIRLLILNRQGGLSLGPIYGALTGNAIKVAYIPRNLADVDLNKFNSHLGENKTISLNDYPHLK